MNDQSYSPTSTTAWANLQTQADNIDDVKIGVFGLGIELDGLVEKNLYNGNSTTKYGSNYKYGF